ncbi:hypothetical protein AB0948_26995 [Streptomyces koyangensis]|uniref:hypothetical protein n=1 Tax=Streptomyces koyangensis TaxID=188770 RepID=UPI00345431D1
MLLYESTQFGRQQDRLAVECDVPVRLLLVEAVSGQGDDAGDLHPIEPDHRADDADVERKLVVVEAATKLSVVLVLGEKVRGVGLDLRGEFDPAGEAAGECPADERPDPLAPCGMRGEPEVEGLLAEGAQIELVLVEPGHEQGGGADVGAVSAG